ncbi:hypothetical protein [Nannocystis pusilla]|uniref:Uncharacterized protein n=1 Tax=Nannocystis pusilla TaxID=889268 RepID=A0ABS7TRW1_9BACT|nr:hypothetical protein [Nannocystis pusilla]MBZ5710970.1 hypothetical protein [Nannocystis pusilla]
MKDLEFTLKTMGLPSWDPEEDNVDVVVTLPDGRRFAATFFTLKNVQLLFTRNRATGECLHGLYFWSANMILVETLTEDTIYKSVKDMLETEEFFTAFAELRPLEDDGDDGAARGR